VAEGSAPRPLLRRGLIAGFLLATAVALANALPLEIVQQHLAAGEAPLCGAGVSLGALRVTPEFAWRADQKERPRREEIALRALRAELAELPCARGFAFAGEADAASAPDTELSIRLHELGPSFVVTLLPPQWLGWSEVDATLRATRVTDGAVLLDAHVTRRRGGPFALRGEAPLESELRAALAPLLRGAPVR